MANRIKTHSSLFEPRRSVWTGSPHDDPGTGETLYRVGRSRPEVCFPPTDPGAATTPDPVPEAPDWIERYRDASRQMGVMVRMSLDLIGLRGQLTELSREVTALKETGPGAYVLVQTFAPEPYAVLTPFQVSVKVVGDEYTACFPDANLTAYGDTEVEAVENLKSVILDTFDKFSDGRKLGPGPTRQLAVLREFVRKRG